MPPQGEVPRLHADLRSAAVRPPPAESPATTIFDAATPEFAALDRQQLCRPTLLGMGVPARGDTLA